MAPLGLRLPAEARTWWAWHDGAEPDPAAVSRQLGPGQEYLSLREAVRLYQDEREMFTHDPFVRELRPADRFPIAYVSGPITCDCSVDEGAPTPIFHVHSHDYDIDGVRNPKAGSFGEMVTWWIEALEGGGWVWDRSGSHWTRNESRLDARHSASGLV